MITLLVDLDGTITDPAPGMIGAFRCALERMGVTPPPADNLFWIIGPPTRLSFPKLLRADQNFEEAVRVYRERYGAGGLFEARVYDGMPEALQALQALPARLFVCTAKPHTFAVPISALRAHVLVRRHLRPGPGGSAGLQSPADRSDDREGEPRSDPDSHDRGQGERRASCCASRHSDSRCPVGLWQL